MSAAARNLLLAVRQAGGDIGVTESGRLVGRAPEVL
jgi:hypothetical protein